jgi:hypothetical protein
LINLRNIPVAKEDLDLYEVEHNFHSWSYQPVQSPLRVVSAKGIRFKTEDGRERLKKSRFIGNRFFTHSKESAFKQKVLILLMLLSLAVLLRTIYG